MEFHGEYFQQFFGIIMETTVAPFIAILYLAKLEKKLKDKSINDPKTVWPIFFRWYIDDGFGITKGWRECWILDSGIQQASEIYKNRQIQVWFQSGIHGFDYF